MPDWRCSPMAATRLTRSSPRDGVVEPLDCGLGGGGFATVHAGGVTEYLDFIGAAPLTAAITCIKPTARSTATASCARTGQ